MLISAQAMIWLLELMIDILCMFLYTYLSCTYMKQEPGIEGFVVCVVCVVMLINLKIDSYVCMDKGFIRVDGQSVCLLYFWYI
jgi:hypothetical protein